jgi:hypothetical protein
MTRAQIIDLQRHVGTVPDGFWGPKSIAACQRYLRSLMPTPNPWPGTSQAALQRFYGPPGDSSQQTMINVAVLGVRFGGQAVTRINCHRLVADSLLAILRELSGFAEGRAALAQYAGVYNNRPMRGGSLPSLHARAAAIDLMPAGNGLHTAWPTRSTMPITVMESFARRGWLSAGAFWGRDAMHFQATR